MDHTILPANTQCLPFLRKRSPDGATRTEVRDIQLQLTTHLSTPKGWQAELAWLVDLWRTVYPQLQVERRTRKLREVVCSCAKVSSVTGLSRYGTCCQHQLWRLQQSGHLRRDWMTGAWMWSSKRQLLSSFHYHYKLQVTSYKKYCFVSKLRSKCLKDSSKSPNFNVFDPCKN